MTYLALLLVGLLPPVAVLAARSRSRDVAPAVPGLRQAASLALLTAVAVAATLPWDAAMIAAGTWRYPPGQVLGRVAGVPLEEVAFMVLQPVLVGLWARGLPAGLGRPGARPARPTRVRAVGAAACLGAAAAGAALCAVPHTAYAGGLLAWAAPSLALQCAAAGDVLWAHRRLLAAGLLPPVLWLCALDLLALHLHVWVLSPARTTGLLLLGLPVEEALFFLLTSLLVLSGLVLLTDRTTVARLRALVAPRTGVPAAVR